MDEIICQVGSNFGIKISMVNRQIYRTVNSDMQLSYKAKPLEAI